MKRSLGFSALALSICVLASSGRAQFRDDFARSKIEGWFTMTGDGQAKLDFQQKDGFARMAVDATQDPYGVWWAIIKRDVTRSLDLTKLADPDYELRVEARVRASVAPRRVNFMLNTNRTTNFHEHLREYDIADTTEWHVISMTTRNFDAKPGDTVYVQLGVTDWGPGQYHLDIDYYRADVVRRDEAAPDLGEPLVYHPPVPEMNTFAHHLGVTDDSVINSDFPDVNFNDWHVVEPGGGTARVLSINAHQWTVLRWDFARFHGQKAAGAGVLELTTQSLPHGGKYIEHWGQDFGEEFGKLHVIEILGGDPAWDQATVTYNSLLRGGSPAEVFNPQMTIDLELAEKPGGKAYFTLPRPVMQRLLDGTTKGILLRQLGAYAPTIYASENAAGNGPVLHFSTAE